MPATRAPSVPKLANPTERLNGKIERRTDVVDIFLYEDAITRLFGALLLDHDDECAVQRERCVTLESITQLNDDPALMRRPWRPDQYRPGQ